MDLTQIKTTSGKTIKDFDIPEALIKQDPELIKLVLESESMNDEERQYWLSLTEHMNHEQIEKLRDILVREKQKLAEIEAKYAKKNMTPEQAQELALQKAEERLEEQEEIKEQEAAHEASEAKKEADILKELNEL